MQAHGVSIGAAHGGNLLPYLHALTVIDHQLIVMGVGANVIFIVLNHDQITVTAQLVADIHHFASAGGVHRLPTRPGDINPFIPAIA